MHVIVWEFAVSDEHREAFEKAYGPEGDWAILFRTAPGYRGTELLRDEHVTGRYLTIDRWDTAEDFAPFKERSSETYEAIDRKFESLTYHEIKLGTFEVSDIRA